MKSTLAIIDNRVSKTVKKNLSKNVEEIFLFNSKSATYNSISGHPDIFLYQDKDNLIVAPNSPSDLLEILSAKSIQFKFGISAVGSTLETSTYYNCISTDKFLFHKNGFTDPAISKANKEKTFINLPQAYTRCSMLNLTEDRFITSDKGIEKILKQNSFDVCFFSPEEIQIFNHKNGFLGGTAGILNNRIYFLGNLLKHKDGKKLEQFIKKCEMEIICLSDNFLYDGGGIFFISY